MKRKITLKVEYSSTLHDRNHSITKINCFLCDEILHKEIYTFYQLKILK